jgi:hypothetical protein
MGGVVLRWDYLRGPVDRSQRWSTGIFRSDLQVPYGIVRRTRRVEGGRNVVCVFPIPSRFENQSNLENDRFVWLFSRMF